jgi:hypothetical protein
LFSEARNASAMKSCVAGYELSNKSSIFEEVFVELFLYDIWESVDEEDVLMIMNDQIKVYPFLENNLRYKKVYFVANAEKVINYFDDNNLTKGNLAHKEFINLIESINKDELEDIQSSIDEMNIDIFSSISTYFYRSKKYKDVFLWINKALELDSDAERLIRKKTYIERKM